jgi:hypothetical protein
MKRRVTPVILLAATAAMCSACLAPEVPALEPAFTLVPTLTATEISGSPSPTLAPTEPSPPPTVAVFNANIPTQAAISALAAALNVPEESIIVVDTPLPVQWSDTSLGCPRPDQVYAQVMTPGYLFTLAVDDATYNVHTDLVGMAVVCFDATEPVGPGAVPDPVVAEFIETARSDLAAQLAVPPEEIILVRSEAVEWSDSSIGCREEGVEYIQVITFGYRIVLVWGEQHFEYHTDQHRMILCPNPTE